MYVCVYIYIYIYTQIDRYNRWTERMISGAGVSPRGLLGCGPTGSTLYIYIYITVNTNINKYAYIYIYRLCCCSCCLLQP